MPQYNTEDMVYPQKLNTRMMEPHAMMPPFPGYHQGELMPMMMNGTVPRMGYGIGMGGIPIPMQGPIGLMNRPPPLRYNAPYPEYALPTSPSLIANGYEGKLLKFGISQSESFGANFDLDKASSYFEVNRDSQWK